MDSRRCPSCKTHYFSTQGWFSTSRVCLGPAPRPDPLGLNMAATGALLLLPEPDAEADAAGLSATFSLLLEAFLPAAAALIRSKALVGFVVGAISLY